MTDILVPVERSRSSASDEPETQVKASREDRSTINWRVGSEVPFPLLGAALAAGCLVGFSTAPYSGYFRHTAPTNTWKAEAPLRAGIVHSETIFEYSPKLVGMGRLGLEITRAEPFEPDWEM